jgi:hypothetical protein
MMSVHELGERFVTALNELLDKSDWVVVKSEFRAYLNSVDLLMLGMRQTMLQHRAELNNSVEYMDGVFPLPDEVSLVLAKEDFDRTGLSLFLDVNWVALGAHGAAEVDEKVLLRWELVKRFYRTVLLGLMVAEDWVQSQPTDNSELSSSSNNECSLLSSSTTK